MKVSRSKRSKRLPSPLILLSRVAAAISVSTILASIATAQYYYRSNELYATQTCIDEACARGATCSLDSVLQNVVVACRGVDGACVNSACNKGANCALEQELFSVIRSCRGADGVCVEAACRKGTECSTQSGLENIIRLCKGRGN